MAKLIFIKKNWLLKTLVFVLGFLSLCLACYLIFLPLYPLLKYTASQPKNDNKLDNNQFNENNLASSSPTVIINQIPAEEIANSLNRVIIKKIGVDVSIVEAPMEQSKTALNKGAWRMPQTSTPEKGSNTVISAHRYKYLPPSNLTFYLLDKLTKGDIVTVIWEKKQYNYKVTESKIVSPTEVSILNSTDKPILTLFTCDPIWSEKNRLVVTGELVE